MSESRQSVWEAHGAWLLSLSDDVGRGDSELENNSQELSQRGSRTAAETGRLCDGSHPVHGAEDKEVDPRFQERTDDVTSSEISSSPILMASRENEPAGSVDMAPVMTTQAFRGRENSSKRVNFPDPTVSAHEPHDSGFSAAVSSEHSASPILTAPSQNACKEPGASAADSPGLAASPTLTASQASDAPDMSFEREDSPILTAPSASHEPDAPWATSSELERATSPVLKAPPASRQPDMSFEREDSPILTAPSAPSASHEPDAPWATSSELERATSPVLRAPPAPDVSFEREDSPILTATSREMLATFSEEAGEVKSAFEGVVGLLMLSQGDSVHSEPVTEPHETGEEAETAASQNEKSTEQLFSQASTDDAPSSPVLSAQIARSQDKTTPQGCVISASELTAFTSKHVNSHAKEDEQDEPVAKSSSSNEVQQAAKTLPGQRFSPPPENETTDDEEDGNLEIFEQNEVPVAVPASSPAGASGACRASTADSYNVGAVVEVLFADGVWYAGTISKWLGQKAAIDFEDGDQQVLRLPHPDVRLPELSEGGGGGGREEGGEGGGGNLRESVGTEGEEKDGAGKKEDSRREEGVREAGSSGLDDAMGTEEKCDEGQSGASIGGPKVGVPRPDSLHLQDTAAATPGPELEERIVDGPATADHVNVMETESFVGLGSDQQSRSAPANVSKAGCDEGDDGPRQGGSPPMKRVTFYHEGANGEPVADEVRLAANLIGPWRVGQNPQKYLASDAAPKATLALTAPREMDGFLHDIVFSCSQDKERMARWLPDVIDNGCVERFPAPESPSESDASSDSSGDDDGRATSPVQSCSQPQALREKEKEDRAKMSQLLSGRGTGFCFRASPGKTQTECFRVRVLEHDRKSARALVSYVGYRQKWNEWVSVQHLTVVKPENRLSKSQALQSTAKVTKTGVELKEDEAEELLMDEDLFCPSKNKQKDVGKEIEVLVTDPDEDLRVWQRGVIREHLRKEIYRVKLFPHKDTQASNKLVTVDCEEVFVRNVPPPGKADLDYAAAASLLVSQALPSSANLPESKSQPMDSAPDGARRSSRLPAPRDRGRPVGAVGGGAAKKGGGNLKGKERASAGASGPAPAASAEDKTGGGAPGAGEPRGEVQPSGAQSASGTLSWTGTKRRLTSQQAVEVYRLRPSKLKVAPSSERASRECKELAARFSIDEAEVRDIWAGKKYAQATGHPASSGEPEGSTGELDPAQTSKMETEDTQMDIEPEEVCDDDTSDGSDGGEAPEVDTDGNQAAGISLPEGVVPLDPEETALMSSLLMLDGKMAEYCQQVKHFVAGDLSSSRPSFEYSPTSLINISSEETAYLASLLLLDPSFDDYCRRVQDYLGDASAMSTTWASIENAMQD